MKLSRTQNPMLADVFHPEFFNKMFNEFFQDVTPAHLQTPDFSPRAEIAKAENSYTVKVSLPGTKKEDIKISFDKNILTISGEKKSEQEENKNNIIRSEFRYGKFNRSFRIDSDIDKEGIHAEFSDGVLKVLLPFTEKSTPTAIEIK